ncbi:hypothetical protein IPF37_04060 [bacterium]|nr:MAG: hypothetical protein IPF37_04060 [bacterium]
MYLFHHKTLRSGIATLLVAGFCLFNVYSVEENKALSSTNDKYSYEQLAQITTAALRGPALFSHIYHEKKGNVKRAAALAVLLDVLRVSNGVLALHNSTTNKQHYNLAWLGYDVAALSADLVAMITSFDAPEKQKGDAKLHKKVDKLLVSLQYVLLPLSEAVLTTFSALATDNPEQQVKADALNSFVRMASVFLASKPKSLEAKLELALLGLSAWMVWQEFKKPADDKPAGGQPAGQQSQGSESDDKKSDSSLNDKEPEKDILEKNDVENGKEAEKANAPSGSGEKPIAAESVVGSDGQAVDKVAEEQISVSGTQAPVPNLVPAQVIPVASGSEVEASVQQAASNSEANSGVRVVVEATLTQDRASVKNGLVPHNESVVLTINMPAFVPDVNSVQNLPVASDSEVEASVQQPVLNAEADQNAPAPAEQAAPLQELIQNSSDAEPVVNAVSESVALAPEEAVNQDLTVAPVQEISVPAQTQADRDLDLSFARTLQNEGPRRSERLKKRMTNA